MGRIGRRCETAAMLSFVGIMTLTGCWGAAVAVDEDGGLDDGGAGGGGGSGGCGAGSHACGDTCMFDRFDSPEYGCRLGCGEPCAEPDGGRVVCEEGECAYVACLTCDDVGAQCGSISDGCGNVLECGTCDTSLRCDDNACVACPDDLEPSTEESPTSVGELADIPNSSAYYGSLSLHATGDEDWFHVDVEDRGDTIFETGGPPNITVTVDSFPEGLAPTLEAVFSCHAGTTTMNCGAGSVLVDGKCADSTVQEGELRTFLDVDCTPNDGNDADGDLYIRVSASTNPGPDVCGIYELHVYVQ